ncbi:MAG TPA: SulP family inorganic anion transporter, partial [Candidatus Binatia bacterium]|nr:SulP family inorganic anion transporter [Candidatus Binatia bacterium]
VPAEIIAGVTLAAIAIPQVLGYAKIAGVPVITGLYTLLIPTALFAVFGSSRHLAVAADSATAAILGAGLFGLASIGSEAHMALATVLALMAGGFVLLARVLGLAFMADFLSRTVLIGFLTGVGIQVALGQLSGMLGLHGGGHGTLLKIWADLQQIEEINFYSLGIALCAVAVIAGAKSISHRIPGALIAVIGAIVASWALDLGAQVHVLGQVSGGLPAISLPKVDWSLELLNQLVPTALALSVVILAQSAAIARAYAARHNERFSENTDLVGLGIANIGASLSGAFVVNSSPTRAQIVDSAGGRTQLPMLITTLIVLAVLLFLTAPLAYMPEAVLSAVVFLVGIGLIDLRGLRSVYWQRRSEFWIALITTLMVVMIGVEQGILLAIVLSLVDHTRRGYRPKNSVVVRGATGAWQEQPVATGTQVLPGLIIYRFNHSMYYANAQQLTEEIATLVKNANPPLRWLCIDAAAVDDVDYTAAETLRSMFGLLKEKGVRLVVAQVMSEVAKESRYDFRRLFGEDAFYETLGGVVAEYQHWTGQTQPATKGVR